MKATIFTHVDDLSTIPDKLTKLYGPGNVSVESEDGIWTSIKIQRKRLLVKSTIIFNVMRYSPQLEQMKKGMAHAFSAIQTPHEELRSKLVMRLGFIESAIAIAPESKVRGLEQAVFDVAQEVNGLIFFNGNQMLNEKGKLVLDFNGDTRVDDVEVFANSKRMDLPEEEIPADAQARKEKSEVWLEEMNVPMNHNLPPIVGEEQVSSRPISEVVDRTLALALVAVKGEGLEQKLVEQIHNDFGIQGKLSPKEEAFFRDQDPSQQDKINFVWRYESLNVLLWYLGYNEELTYPGGICDVQFLVGVVRDAGGSTGLTKQAQVRSLDNLLQESDRIYRLHWAVVDARLRGQDGPADLEPGVVYERHYALNWLIGHHGAEWDDVSTDT